MEITPLNTVQPIAKTAPIKKIGDTGLGASKSSDITVISEEGRLHSIILGAMNDKDLNREKHIAEIKRNIAEGKYNINERVLEGIALSLLEQG